MVSNRCDSLDPRIRRTRQLLQQSLEKLLETKDFDRISVQDIADLATVNRATFYDHYNDKSALLTAMVGCRFHQFLAERQVHFDGTCALALQAMVLAVSEYLTHMQGPDGKREPEPHMESAIIAVLRHLLLEGLSQHPPKDGLPVELVAAAAGWAIYGAVKEWTHTANRTTAEALAVTVMTMVAPILQVPFAQAPEPALLNS
ncbi:MAG TPA: TetR/AcrR family transcriptional regulator [Bryobacteraceae bacterium]|jgi:AcrR family transcriptional regulator|nr:TetR/AcrR family transcriptional regulator [Bryobacteraceae bacterium]